MGESERAPISPFDEPMAALRRADAALAAAPDQASAAAAAVRQLEARERLERVAWTQADIPEGLLQGLVARGAWSWEYALFRLRLVDFVKRHAVLRAWAGDVPEGLLPVALTLALEPQQGDGELFFQDEIAAARILPRLAQAGESGAVLAALPRLEERRAEGLAGCVPYLPEEAARQAIGETLASIATAAPFVQLTSYCHLLRALHGEAQAEALRQARRLRAAFEAGDWEVASAFDARRYLARACALAGMLEASEAEREGLEEEEEEETPDSAPLSLEERTGRLIFGDGHAAIATEVGFSALLDFAGHGAHGDELALVVHYASTLSGPRRAALSRALLASGEDLYELPEINALLSPEELRAHLLGALARYEQPKVVELLYTLEQGVRLVDGPRREATFPLFLKEVRALGGARRGRYLVHAAALARGDLRADLVAEACAALGDEEVDGDDRADAVAMLFAALGGETHTLPPQARERFSGAARGLPDALQKLPDVAREIVPFLDAEGRQWLAARVGDGDLGNDPPSESLLFDHLSGDEARAAWSERAGAAAWRRTLDIADRALFAYLPSAHWLHAEAVLRLLRRAFGEAAVVACLEMLVHFHAPGPGTASPSP